MTLHNCVPPCSLFSNFLPSLPEEKQLYCEVNCGIIYNESRFKIEAKEYVLCTVHLHIM